jgi:hypothetical protein
MNVCRHVRQRIEPGAATGGCPWTNPKKRKQEIARSKRREISMIANERKKEERVEGKETLPSCPAPHNCRLRHAPPLFSTSFSLQTPPYAMSTRSVTRAAAAAEAAVAAAGIPVDGIDGAAETSSNGMWQNICIPSARSHIYLYYQSKTQSRRRTASPRNLLIQIRQLRYAAHSYHERRERR